jgi:hypothetical protein
MLLKDNLHNIRKNQLRRSESLQISLGAYYPDSGYKISFASSSCGKSLKKQCCLKNI